MTGNLVVSGTNAAINITAGGTSEDSVLNFVQGSTTEGGITFDHNGSYGSENIKFRVGNNTEHLKIMGDGRGLSQFTAKAWAILMTDTTNPSFRDSHNCSSITDNAVGDVTVNYTNNMGQSAHVVVGSAGMETTNPSDRNVATVPVNAGAARLEIYDVGGTHRDMAYVSMLAFGD